MVQLGALLSPALVDRPASRGGLEMHATNPRSGLNGCFRLRRARAWPRCRRSSGVRNLRRSAALSEDADATSTTSVSADNGLGSEGRLVVYMCSTCAVHVQYEGERYAPINYSYTSLTVLGSDAEVAWLFASSGFLLLVLLMRCFWSYSGPGPPAPCGLLPVAPFEDCTAAPRSLGSRPYTR